MLKIKKSCDLTSQKLMIKKLVNEIADEFIIDTIESNIDDVGLYGSRLGKSLFLSQYYTLSKKEIHIDKSIEYLESVLNDLATTNLSLSFSRGLTGIGWLISFYINEGLISRKQLSLIQEIEPLIRRGVDIDNKNRIYDPLVGLVGKGVFYLELSKVDKNYIAMLNKVIDSLLDMSIKVDDELRTWEDNYSIDKKHSNEQSYTLGGMAHGVPGVIVFLCQCYNKGFRQHEIKTILPQVLNWMFQYQGISNHFSFPNCVIDDLPEDSGRLAWCVGDLGVFLALLRTGKILGENVFNKIKNDINRVVGIGLEKSFVDLSKEKLIDLSVCHGVSGIIHMIDMIDKEEPITNNRINYWLDKIINQKNDLRFPPDEHLQEWGDNDGLLLGKSGLGLILLKQLKPTLTNWDNCLITGK